MQRRVLDILKSATKRNRLAYKIARHLYSRYSRLAYSRESRARIKQPDVADYLHSSSKADLNVIVLVVDCLRASQLSCHGYSRRTTPFLDSLGSRFRAVSASCWTSPAVASLLTGLYPHNHGAVMGGQIKSFDRLENLLRLRKNVITLPEVLSHLRYDLYFGTAIGVAFHPLRGRTVLKRPQWYDPSARADELLSDLAGWIAGKSGLFFAYLQLGDLHEPLKPPDDFRNHFGNVKDLPLIDRWNFRRPEEQQGAQFQEYRENRILLYDNTLRNVDRAIERFCGTLKDRGLLSSTILIITADHGEEFWEHAGLEAENFYDPRGYYGVGHGHNVFNEIIQVPVVIAGPGVPEKQYAHVISTVDIVPTALDLLGIEHRLKFDGQNVFQQQATGTRLLSEASGFGYEKKALIIGRFKLIYSQDDGVAWVFDLEKDPQELHPITEQGVVSMFVDKLSEMQRRGEARRIREKIEARSLTKL